MNLGVMTVPSFLSLYLRLRADYINAAFNEIYNKYDKVEDFVVKELDIDVKTIDTIKERVLE